MFFSVVARTRTKDKYRIVYSDHQRLELEKEFHYSRSGSFTYNCCLSIQQTSLALSCPAITSHHITSHLNPSCHSPVFPSYPTQHLSSRPSPGYMHRRAISILLNPAGPYLPVSCPTHPDPVQPIPCPCPALTILLQPSPSDYIPS
jgi:hypothetical protein